MRALWLVGFRPFFLLAMLSGGLLPMLWVLIFGGLLPAPLTSFSSVQWHAHEMFFGFAMAMLTGFLLTASKNWVGIRGYHGWPLMLLAGLWLAERLGMWFEQALPGPLFLASNQAFLLLAVGMLAHTLVRHRRTDSYYPDNVWFVLLLALFPAAKTLLLTDAYAQLGQSMATGLFRLAFLVMLERTLTQFMKSLFQAAILRHPLLDQTIKGLALLCVFVDAMPVWLAWPASLLLAVLLTVRFAFWQPLKALRRLDLGIMYLGYLAIVLQLVLTVLSAIWPLDLMRAAILHVFTMGGIGLIVPAMIVRISKGHTGRQVIFGPADKAALWLMMAAFVLRILAPQGAPGAYLAWLVLAAACWLACFAILVWRYGPFLLAPRLDGKDH